MSNFYHLWQKMFASFKKNITISCLKFNQNNETYSGQFNSLVHNEKDLVLDYLCVGKVVIPYKKINGSN